MYGRRQKQGHLVPLVEVRPGQPLSSLLCPLPCHLPFHSPTPLSPCCVISPLFNTTGCNSPGCIKIDGTRVVPPPRAKIAVNEGGGGPVPLSCVVFKVGLPPGIKIEVNNGGNWGEREGLRTFPSSVCTWLLNLEMTTKLHHVMLTPPPPNHNGRHNNKGGGGLLCPPQASTSLNLPQPPSTTPKIKCDARFGGVFNLLGFNPHQEIAT